MERAGIAPASRNPQVVIQHDSCVDTPSPCLHTACTDFALRELVACWQQLSAGVRERIVRIARGQGDISRVGEEAMVMFCGPEEVLPQTGFFESHRA